MKGKICLPTPDKMLRKSKSLAMLDAIYCQQWDLRYFSHNSRWGETEEMGSMRDGEGCDYFILFSADGTAMKGGFLRAKTGAKRLLDEIHSPIQAKFSNFIHEPAFSIDDASFIAWFDDENNEWIKIGASHPASDADGSEYLTGWLRGDADFYRQWACDYYERDIDSSLVRHIFSVEPLDMAMFKRLGLDLDEQQLLEDIDEIGYPWI